MPPVSEVDMGPVKESSDGLTRSDCVCTICLDIFMEPVTLPCTHTFCKPCFLETVDKSNMCCPLCRKRVSTWARLNSRNKTLVNMEFWRRIQNAFPEECERRLQGIEDVDVDMVIPRPRVCQPGEVRREYEDQISKLVEEKRALEEAERRASEEYIQRLLAEEEEPLAEAKRRLEEQQLENDERLARLLSQELNSGPISESSWNIKPVDATPLKKKKTPGGDIEKFLRPVPHKQPNSDSSPDSSIMANKENILNHPKTLLSQSEKNMADQNIPVLDYYGKPSTSNSNSDCLEQTYSSPNNTTSKRKSSEIEVETEEDLLKKRPCCEQPLVESPVLSEMVWYEEALRSRWQQEEEDRRLALRLQKELNRDNSVDRRKGSADSYQLRQKNSMASPSSNPDEESTRRNSATNTRSSTGRREDKEKADKKLSGTSAHQVGTSSGKCTVSSPPATTTTTVQSTPLKKGTKQTTLTEMFTNMSS